MARCGKHSAPRASSQSLLPVKRRWGLKQYFFAVVLAARLCESMLMHNLCVSPCIKHGAAEGGYVAVPNVLLLKITLIKKKKKTWWEMQTAGITWDPSSWEKNYIGKAEQDRLCRCGLSRLVGVKGQGNAVNCLTGPEKPAKDTTQC